MTPCINISAIDYKG